MKRLFASLMLLATIASASAKTKHYEADWKSINTYEIPSWALDAKFGLYAHWGPYSLVGSWQENETYPTHGTYYTVGYSGIYTPDEYDPRRKAFESRYGAIADGHGYYELCEDFTAQGFDPEAWAEIAEYSGAEYVGMCAVHHDGYMMWDSEISDMCAGKTGAKRDLLGDLFKELEKRDIRTIATLHHARTDFMFNGWADKLAAEGYANCDIVSEEGRSKYWFTGDKADFEAKEMAITKELINKYKPDVIWFDGGVKSKSTKETVAEFLNMGVREGKEVCLHNKHRMFGDDFGVYSYERGYLRPHSLLHHPWEDDETSSVDGCWCWWHGIDYRMSSDLIKRLCHLTAINGGLLISLNPRPDGSFDPEMVEQLRGIGEWLKQNGEAIHGSRPWKIQGEGHMDELSLRYIWSSKLQARYATPNVNMFDTTDFRFTTQKDALYAIQLAIPRNGEALIKSLSNKNVVSSGNEIESIELIGHGKVEFERTDDFLRIKLPKKMPNGVALVYKIKVKGEIERILFQGKR